MTGITASKHFKKRLTTKIGDIAYNQEDIFFFENGIYGFENLRDFIVVELPSPEIPKFYRYVQSLEKEDLSLIIMNIVFGKNGEGIIHAKDLEPHLGKRGLSLKDTCIFLVTAIREEDGTQRISVNAKAPLILVPKLQKVYWSLFARQFLHAFRDIISLVKNPFFKCKVVVAVAPVDMWVSRKTYPSYSLRPTL